MAQRELVKRCAPVRVYVPSIVTDGMNAAALPTSVQRACTRRSCAIRYETLFETAASMSSVRTGSLNCAHQALIISAVMTARGSSLVAAALNSPVAVWLVVGYPASGTERCSIETCGFS